MTEPFTPDDDGQRFSLSQTDEPDAQGRLEFPLDDPGDAEPGQGILWLDEPHIVDGEPWHWYYVSPSDVRRLED